MKNPSHPIELLHEGLIKELNLSVNEIAEQLAMLCIALSRVLNRKSMISANLSYEA
ncbi:hypothetical protein [Bartonella senegalensis]|uniref:hypothetical protein n=1 Tax=Bartonella senegalensis TaxID=1468418 RepID=UPI0003053FFB|nr:hypothetical protein [Bartonella senegalensis]